MALGYQNDGESIRNLGYVVMGHHKDDTDENVIAELGKGNIVNVTGMQTTSEVLGVPILRPLLHLRKQDMFSLVCV